jgi:hypothetical protein
VQPSTPLGPDQVNVLLSMAVDLKTSNHVAGQKVSIKRYTGDNNRLLIRFNREPLSHLTHSCDQQDAKLAFHKTTTDGAIKVDFNPLPKGHISQFVPFHYHFQLDGVYAAYRGTEEHYLGGMWRMIPGVVKTQNETLMLSIFELTGFS